MSAKRVIQGLGLVVVLVCAGLLGKSIYDQTAVSVVEQPAVVTSSTALRVETSTDTAE